MRKKCLPIALVMCCVILSSAENYGGKIGFNFFAGGTSLIGVRFHINDRYCLSPELGIRFYGHDVWSGVVVANQFYLPSLPIIDHYIDINGGVIFTSDYIGGTAGAGYGVQYAFNKTVSLFGELGFSFRFNDGYDVQFSLAGSGAGFILYIR